MDIQATLEEIEAEIQPLLGQGQVADYIPALASVDPKQFGMAVTLNDGTQFGVGAYDKKFSIQSISKLFTFTLALDAYSTELYKRV
ncbi:MAG: glutaminase, partial [Hydrogenimonas sp.]